MNVYAVRVLHNYGQTVEIVNAENEEQAQAIVQIREDQRWSEGCVDEAQCVGSALPGATVGIIFSGGYIE